MTKSLFLTPQTKELLGSLTQELKTGASISLLYGDPGSGKTRLMREIRHNRNADTGFQWIELSARHRGDDSKKDRCFRVETAFNDANHGDIVFVDHFESALQKTRHQLFLSWATAGVEKNLKLIIACNTESFKELRQLLQQYQLQTKSFQIMPFNNDELESFLVFQLYPDQPAGKLSMPGPLRVKFAVAHGIVGRIIDIARRDHAQIEYRSANKHRLMSKGSSAIIAALGLFALVVTVRLPYLNGSDKLPESTPVVANESSSQAMLTEPEVRVVAESEGGVVDEVVSEPGVAAESEVGLLDKVVTERRVVTEPEASAMDEPVPEPGAETESQTAAVVEVVTDPEPIDNPTQAPATKTVAEVEAIPVSAIASEVISDTDDMTESLDLAAITQEPGTKLAAVIIEEPIAIESTSTKSSANDLNRPEPTRFERQLQESMDWINRNDNSVGTIQILLLSFKNFDVNGFYEHVDYLASQQVDISRLRVIKTYTGDQIAYSVFYGEFESWEAAGNSRNDLPEVLRKNSPIPRSIGGIVKEIQRLGARTLKLSV